MEQTFFSQNEYFYGCLCTLFSRPSVISVPSMIVYSARIGIVGPSWYTADLLLICTITATELWVALSALYKEKE